MSLRTAIRRARGQDGFTMVVAMLVLLVVSLVSAAAYAAANDDVRLGGYSQDQKRAYAAAQAGLAWYEAQLAKDPSYWMKCTTPPAITGATMPIENPWDGTSARPWRTVSGSTEQYVIDLLPVSPPCDPNNAVGTMINAANGTFRIRVTGRSRNDPSAPRRSIVATFHRRGFLDFIYFTDLEDADPALWEQLWLSQYDTANNIQSWTVDATHQDPVTWINANCTLHWWQGRSTALYSDTYKRYDGTTGSATNLNLCSNGEIMFAAGDVVAGPMHTNDSIMVCSQSGQTGPTFGRTSADAEELSSPQSSAVRAYTGASPPSGCTASPNWQGTVRYGVTPMTLPPSNGSLSGQASPGYRFTGRTTIVLGTPSADQMTVTNASMGLSNYVMSQPPNGVVYVANGTCGASYDRFNPDGDPTSCGDLYVKGTYDQNLTLAAQKDVVVNGSLTNSGDVLLGLIADEHVRVAHPNGCLSTAANPITIDAAILTVTGSFLVDDWWCGSSLGTLTVTGAIAQKYRGIVGSTSSGSGYIKSYTYDDRFRYREPPDFLDPVQAGWKVVRITEQSPAT